MFKKNANHVNFFFIRGFMRSGTNWACNLLNLHPKVSCSGEFYFEQIRDALNERLSSVYSLLSRPNVQKKAEEKFEELVKACMVEAADISNKKEVLWYGDRTPRELEPVLIRGSKHFLMVRDPRDILISWAFHLLRLNLSGSPDDPHNIHFDKFPKMHEKRLVFEKEPTFFKRHPEALLSDNEAWVRDIAQQWKYRTGLNIKAINKIKSGELDAGVQIVKYENLHQNFDDERKRMYQFLGLDPKDALPVNELTTPGFKKEDLTSHNRKGIIGDWHNYFTPEIAGWFHEEVGDLLLYFDYIKDHSWIS